MIRSRSRSKIALKVDNPLAEAVSRFGATLKPKLSRMGAAGAPEDQLRAPLESLLADVASILGFRTSEVVPVGEASLSALKTRPDYAVKVKNALVGFVEVKAPGKGADPRKFKDDHDREQWDKLKSLPNLVYTDGNAFSLWRDGKLHGEVVQLHGDVETTGKALAAPPSLERLFSDFLRWKPVTPTSAPALAEVSAGLCRLLRDEVTEQLALGTPALTGLAEDWRRLLFPEATDEQFADGYAQELGREVVWLHTFGERFTAPKEGRPASAPHLPASERPTVPKGGGIPSEADAMPEAMSYDSTSRCLQVGSGHVDNVTPEVWACEVSGKQVLTHWFSYRGRDRSRPIIGDRRPPSPLGKIQPEGWLAEYTTELLNVLNVLGRLVALEPKQAHILKRICAGATISGDVLKSAIAATAPSTSHRKTAKLRNQKQGELLG